ncbi:DUF4189 domain-containing protein [Agrobacterium sp. a22-2]|uniref:DUF4189 domain-containing protein n=1 Tax=Agrobacterium sp. a22-2 TaxID=2283840 RepID=UPI001FEF3370|nr:DUF4189 domain-containing protein [Agrobacterium sp. a22-2]
MMRLPTTKIMTCLAILTATLLPVHASADSFGALAYSPATGSTGWSHSHTARRAAERTALDGCAQYADDCRVAIWFKNACGALAAGPNGWGSGWGDDRARAEYEAMKVCSRNTRGCRTIRWQCSGAR